MNKSLFSAESNQNRTTVHCIISHLQVLAQQVARHYLLHETLVQVVTIFVDSVQ